MFAARHIRTSSDIVRKAHYLVGRLNDSEFASYTRCAITMLNEFLGDVDVRVLEITLQNVPDPFSARICIQSIGLMPWLSGTGLFRDIEPGGVGEHRQLKPFPPRLQCSLPSLSPIWCHRALWLSKTSRGQGEVRIQLVSVRVDDVPSPSSFSEPPSCRHASIIHTTLKKPWPSMATSRSRPESMNSPWVNCLYTATRFVPCPT